MARKRRTKPKPVWDVNVPVVQNAEEATRLIKKAERTLAARYRRNPPSPRRSMPTRDFVFNF